MSEPEQGVGAILRAAREARGLSVQDAAQQLRLMNRQIVAMETDDFASIGQPVFARGFVRNYARMLGLDADAILQSMGGAQVEPVEVIQTPSLVLPGKWFTSGWLIAGMVLLLLVTVLPIGLYAWLSSDAEEVTRPVTQRSPATAPTALPATPIPSEQPGVTPVALDNEGATSSMQLTTPLRIHWRPHPKRPPHPPRLNAKYVLNLPKMRGWKSRMAQGKSCIAI